MCPIEARITFWRSLIDHPAYKNYDLVLYEYMCRIHRKKLWAKTWKKDVSRFYLSH